MITDLLRPPPLFDPTAGAYKDWLHLNVFDPVSGAIGLFNASLHGSPSDPRSRVIGTALVHLPGEGWIGNVEIAGMEDVEIGTSSIALAAIAVATDPAAGMVLASAQMPDEGLVADLRTTSRAKPVAVELPLPFGPGWISWYVVPRLSVEGTLAIAGRALDLSRAIAYHDHNWGRWHWGDDVGWDWGACVAEEPAATFVVSRATDRAHSRTEGTTLVADVAGERRRFEGAAVRIASEGRLAGSLRRLPGALAALHQDRIAPALPARIEVRADDGVDSVAIEIRPRATLQLVAGDPTRRGYGFVHEMPGAFEATCRIEGRTTRVRGLAIFEYVD